MSPSRPSLPWLSLLNEQLDALERALLQNDAPAAESASAGVQAALQQANTTPERADGPALQAAGQRLAQLRSAMHRAAALNQRALGSLLPDHRQEPTYQALARNGARPVAPR